MNRDDIIRMAREAGLHLATDVNWMPIISLEYAEKFAALVVKPWADQLEVERKRFQELNDVAALGMQHARAAEREACAKVCEDSVEYAGDTLAEAIRARGTGPTSVIYSPGELAARGLTHEDVVKLIKENT